FFKFYLRRVGTPVILSLSASLLIALVLIPLATTKLPVGKKLKERAIIRKANLIYGKLLQWVLNHRFDTALILAGLLFFTFGFLAKKVPQSDMGGQSQRRVFLSLRLPHNLSQEEVSGYFAQIEDSILSKKEYFNTEFIEVGFRKERGRVFLYLNREKNQQWFNVIWNSIAGLVSNDKNVLENKDDILRELQKVIPEKPGVKIRTTWRGGGGQADGEVSVVIYGDDTDRLKILAEEVERRLALIPDIISTETSLEDGNDEIHLTINRETARKNGINPNQVAFSLMYTVRGVNLPKFQSKDKEIQMRIQLKEEDRENLNQLKNTTFTNNVGKAIPLSALASVSVKKGFGRIRRNNGKTNIEVQATTAQANLQKISGQIDHVMKDLMLPFGYSWSKGKRFSRWRRSEQNFGSAIYVAIFFVFLLMGVLFESFVLPLSVMISIPLSFFGAFLALYVTGNPLDMMASIGFIILIGIVVNNAIVLIDLTNKYRISGMNRTEAILNAGKHRFRPILMTAFTTIAGIMPLAVGKSSSADISYGPMGMVIIGGMLVSTLLTLLAVPLLYTFMDDLRNFFIAFFVSLKKKKQL
ncbi:MAG: efflux RND transporter permease subunit, partial [Calditrichia bacterium]|nr:efflux RND transporter permease subunit [Calditrichia bacterium]